MGISSTRTWLIAALISLMTLAGLDAGASERPVKEFFVFTATNPGLWLFHCYVVPHVTNDGQYPGGLLIPVVTEARKSASARGHSSALSSAH